ncbi:MAG: DUF3316 domain-containing protein [Tannerella sp.]|nr:DUF3316 domain-containing protein [Tannerella sp.]
MNIRCLIICLCLLSAFAIKAQTPIDSLSSAGDTIKSPVEKTTGDTLKTVKIVNRKKSVSRSDLLSAKYGLTRFDNKNIPDYEGLLSINEGTAIGAGLYRMKDTYLSPMSYEGYGFRFVNERMKLLNNSNYKFSRQNIVNVDVSSTVNGAENANFLSAFVDYSLCYHYRILPDPFFKILVGGGIRGMLGMVYNTRNGNNPMTLHSDFDLNLSLATIYEFRIKQYPLAVRYQFETPFAGILFSPVYNQSYYEIFSLGNTSDVLKFVSFHNKFAMRNYLTLDFPVAGVTARVGYNGLFYTTNVNNIDRYIISHNVMLGFVKEFVAFGGREMRRRNLFISAYY